MSRIPTLVPGKTRGLRRLIVARESRRYGGMVPGPLKVLLVDLRLGLPLGLVYQYLQFGKSSRLTRLQREMVATVVNGIVGGAP